jgi:hypothetical protein
LLSGDLGAVAIWQAQVAFKHHEQIAVQAQSAGLCKALAAHHGHSPPALR